MKVNQIAIYFSWILQGLCLLEREDYLLEVKFRAKQPHLFAQWYEPDSPHRIAQLKNLGRVLKAPEVIKTILSYDLPKILNVSYFYAEVGDITFEQFKEVYPLRGSDDVHSFRSPNDLDKDEKYHYNPSFSQYSLLESEDLSTFYPRDEALVADPRIEQFLQIYPDLRRDTKSLLHVQQVLDDGYPIDAFGGGVRGKIVASAHGHFPFWISPVGQSLIDFFLSFPFGTAAKLFYPLNLQHFICNNKALQDLMLRALYSEKGTPLFLFLLHFPEKADLIDKIKEHSDLKLFLIDRLSEWRRPFAKVILWDGLPWEFIYLCLLRSDKGPSLKSDRSMRTHVHRREDGFFDFLCRYLRRFQIPHTSVPYKEFREKFDIAKMENECFSTIYEIVRRRGMILGTAVEIPNDFLNMEFELEIQNFLKNKPQRLSFMSLNWLFIKVIEVLNLFPVSRYIFVSDNRFAFINFHVGSLPDKKLADLFEKLNLKMIEFFGMEPVSLPFEVTRRDNQNFSFEGDLIRFLGSFISKMDLDIFYPMVVKKLKNTHDDWNAYYLLTDCLVEILVLKSGDMMPKSGRDYFNSLLEAAQYDKELDAIHEYFQDWEENIDSWCLNINKLYEMLHPLESFCKAIPKEGSVTSANVPHDGGVDKRIPSSVFKDIGFTSDFLDDVRKVSPLIKKFLAQHQLKEIS